MFKSDVKMSMKTIGFIALKTTLNDIPLTPIRRRVVISKNKNAKGVFATAKNRSLDK
jgi:hypothetical protein